MVSLSPPAGSMVTRSKGTSSGKCALSVILLTFQNIPPSESNDSRSHDRQGSPRVLVCHHATSRLSTGQRHVQASHGVLQPRVSCVSVVYLADNRPNGCFVNRTADIRGTRSRVEGDHPRNHQDRRGFRRHRSADVRSARRKSVRATRHVSAKARNPGSSY